MQSFPTTLTIPANPVSALAFASQADREADHCLAHGRTAQAERLAHLALEARLFAAAGATS